MDDQHDAAAQPTDATPKRKILPLPQWMNGERLKEHLPVDKARIFHVPWWQRLLEVGLLVLVAALVTQNYITSPEAQQLPGIEAEWLTSSATIASNAVREHGRIPLWNPYFEFGEPLVDNPFAFVFNPFSSIPVFVLGNTQGIKFSVFVYAALAAVGGWYLAYVLGMGWIGRLTLGLLLLGKGNMHANILTGYYQLGVTQAYIPWVIGGVIATLRGRQPYAPALTAILFAMMWFGGNIWHTLPTLLGVVILWLFHIVERREGRLEFNRDGTLRLMAAGAMTVGITAITLLPIFVNQGAIGGHPDEFGSGASVEYRDALRLFVEDDPTYLATLDIIDAKNQPVIGGLPQFYYSFTSPLWFLVLIFVLIPPIFPLTYVPALQSTWRIWSAGVIMLVLTFTWGKGGTPLWNALYEYVPLVAQWRFVGRALASASFWLAVLIALRTDGLWRSSRAWSSTLGEQLRMPVYIGSTVAVAAIALVASWSSVRTWSNDMGELFLATNVYPQQSCLEWLRDEYPHRMLPVWRLGYNIITPFVDNRVRITDIEADFFVIGRPSTLSGQFIAFRSIEAPFLMIESTVWEQNALERGYTPLESSPMHGNRRCFYYNPDFDLSFAGWFDKAALREMWNDHERFVAEYQDLSYVRGYDWIEVTARGSSDGERVVVVQEISYPGWRVHINGERATMESLDGFQAVTLPARDETFVVTFAYHPRLFYACAFISIVSILGTIVYLLFPRTIIDGINRSAGLVGTRFSGGVSINLPNVFDPTSEIEKVRAQHKQLPAPEETADDTPAQPDEAAQD